MIPLVLAACSQEYGATKSDVGAEAPDSGGDGDGHDELLIAVRRLGLATVDVQVP